MSDLRTTLKLPHGLASFKNVELYYIISKLFGLGGFGESFIEKERLYIGFRKDSHLRFLFLSTLPIISETQTQPSTNIYFGEFSEDFEEIEIYGGPVLYDIFSAERNYLGDGFNISEALKDSERVVVNPIELVEGLLSIISNTNIMDRKSSDIFEITDTDKVPANWKTYLNLFAKYQPEGNDNRDFSDYYYLVAEPIGSFTSLDIPGTIIHNYTRNKNDDYSFSSGPLTSERMKKFPVQTAKTN